MEAAIEVHNGTRGFVSLPNVIVQDPSLSLKAKGLLGYMLSLPEDWNYSQAGLVHCLKEGRDSIMSALAELQSFEYLIVAKNKNSATGQFQYQYHVFSDKADARHFLKTGELPKRKKHEGSNEPDASETIDGEEDENFKPDESDDGESAPVMDCQDGQGVESDPETVEDKSEHNPRSVPATENQHLETPNKQRNIQRPKQKNPLNVTSSKTTVISSDVTSQTQPAKSSEVVTATSNQTFPTPEEDDVFVHYDDTDFENSMFGGFLDENEKNLFDCLLDADLEPREHEESPEESNLSVSSMAKDEADVQIAQDGQAELLQAFHQLCRESVNRNHLDDARSPFNDLISRGFSAQQILRAHRSYVAEAEQTGVPINMRQRLSIFCDFSSPRGISCFISAPKKEPRVLTPSEQDAAREIELRDASPEYDKLCFERDAALAAYCKACLVHDPALSITQERAEAARRSVEDFYAKHCEEVA